jgi:hypothetical protein
MGTITGKMKTDSHGFLSKRCPSCRRRFKVQPGKGSPDPISHCPFCIHYGRDWNTPEQTKFFKALAIGHVGGELDKMMRDTFRGSKNVKVTGSFSAPTATPPVERDGDLPAATTFDCCGETIRHNPADVAQYCIICGKSA